MNLSEMKKKTLALIEEIDEDQESLTSDPDIESKLNYVINQVMFELARVKKIPDYVELQVAEGDMIRFSDIANKAGYEVYQLDIVRGAEHEYKAKGTILKALETGVLEVEFFRYPERINEKTKDSYEFELSDDVLEAMPYGVAADLLKTDVSNNYGKYFAERYEELKMGIDTRYSDWSVRFDGGLEV